MALQFAASVLDRITNVVTGARDRDPHPGHIQNIQVATAGPIVRRGPPRPPNAQPAARKPSAQPPARPPNRQPGAQPSGVLTTKRPKAAFKLELPVAWRTAVVGACLVPQGPALALDEDQLNAHWQGHVQGLGLDNASVAVVVVHVGKTSVRPVAVRGRLIVVPRTAIRPATPQAVEAAVNSTTHLRGFSYAIETCLPTLIECEACHKYRYLARNLVAPAGQWRCGDQSIGGPYISCEWPEEWL